VELIIVRHGETAWTITGQYTGITELELTEHGRAEARGAGALVGGLLAGRRPRVLTSPRRRAIETAALVVPGRPAVVTDLLAELGYGGCEGFTSAQILERHPGWDLWRDGCPGGEAIDDAGDRAARLLEEEVRGDEGPVVVVTHGHFSRILSAVALGLDPSLGGILDSATASVSVIGENRGRPCLSLWNATAALLGSSGLRTASTR
jgi:probable phosphoglycerate mutase